MFKIKSLFPTLITVLILAVVSASCAHAAPTRVDSYGVVTEKSGFSFPKLFGNKNKTDAYGVSTSSKRKVNPLHWDSTRSLTTKSSTNSQGVSTQKQRKLMNNRPRPFRNLGRKLFGG